MIIKGLKLKKKNKKIIVLNHNITVEYLGIWERIHNLDFNYGEFATIENQAGLNSYKISVC